MYSALFVAQSQNQTGRHCSNSGCKSRKHNDLLNNYHFQPVAIETTGVYAKPSTLFLSGSQRSLLIYSIWWPQGATVVPLPPVPGSSQREDCQHIGPCAGLIWSWLSLAYWPHLPLFQCIADAFRLFVLSISFVAVLTLFGATLWRHVSYLTVWIWPQLMKKRELSCLKLLYCFKFIFWL